MTTGGNHGSPGGKHIDPEWMACVIVDAYALGDSTAAKRHGVNRTTVYRYRQRVKTDEALAKLVAEKNAETSHELATLRVSFLRKALAAIEAKLDTGSIYEIAGAIKIVGELHQTALMVGDDELQPSPENEVVAQAEGGRGGVSREADGSAPARH